MEEEEKIVWVNELKIVSFHYESDYERRDSQVRKNTGNGFILRANREVLQWC